MGPDLILLSPLSPDECARRLRAALDGGQRGQRLGGTVGPDRFTIYLSGWGVATRDTAYCYGALSAEPEGTRVTARFRWSLPARIFGFAVAAFVATLGSIWLFLAAFGGAATRDAEGSVAFFGAICLVAAAAIVYSATHTAAAPTHAGRVLITSLLTVVLETEVPTAAAVTTPR